MLFFLIFSGVVSVHADDKPKSVNGQKPKLVKRGGVSPEDRWKEGDVKEYLALPYLASTNYVVGLSIDDIASKLEAMQVVGNYRIVEDKNRSFKSNNKGLNGIVFVLLEEDETAFHVTVHDSQSWNSACDKLFKYITSTVAMWHKIPDYYTVKKINDIYTITRNGKNPQKWHFDLKKMFAISVYSKIRQEDTKGEEKIIEQIDQVIREIAVITEGS